MWRHLRFPYQKKHTQRIWHFFVRILTFKLVFHHKANPYFSGARKGSSESLSGTRITTFMIYLSDVPLGGRTIFPQAGISVKPEAGSALYWYFLHRHIHFKKLGRSYRVICESPDSDNREPKLPTPTLWCSVGRAELTRQSVYGKRAKGPEKVKNNVKLGKRVLQKHKL